jgi:hypothetical protein
LSALARSLIKKPCKAPYRSSSVCLLPSTTILNTVAAAVAIVHRAREIPDWNPLVPFRVLDLGLSNVAPSNLDSGLHGGAHAGFHGADGAHRDWYARHVTE